MTGKQVRYSNSSLIYHLINVSTYLLYRFFKLFSGSKTNSEKTNPLLITGLFRSGTTITSRIVQGMGFSAGPEDHLLKAIGSRKALNPGGFLENHFCMELSMYLFKKTNSWGDTPPEKLRIESLELSAEDDNKMVWFSLTKIHDDRISNVNKLKTQLNGSASSPKGYFNYYFNERSFIKNPHIAVLFPYFKKLFPNSKVLVVFRNPFDAVNSAQKVSPLVNYEVYNSYYEELIAEFKNGNKNIFFFSYDNLVQNEPSSIKKLESLLNNQESGIRNPETFKYVKSKEMPGLAKLDEIPLSTRTLYEFMLNNCINK
jgi:hypothetical protein